MSDQEAQSAAHGTDTGATIDDDLWEWLLSIAAFAAVCVVSARVGKWMRKLLGIPLMTAYIFAGVLLGPLVLGNVQPLRVQAADVVLDAAVAYVALSAGAEMYLAIIRPMRKAVWRVTVAQLVFLVGAGSVVLVALAEPLEIEYLAGLNTTQRWTVAVMSAIILSARSPASAVEIVNELGARGLFTQALLGVTMVRDVVVIGAFACAEELTVRSFPTTTTAGGSPDAQSQGFGDSGEWLLLTPLAELGLSAVAGCLLSLVLYGVLVWDGWIGRVEGALDALQDCVAYSRECGHSLCVRLCGKHPQYKFGRVPTAEHRASIRGIGGPSANGGRVGTDLDEDVESVATEGSLSDDDDSEDWAESVARRVSFLRGLMVSFCGLLLSRVSDVLQRGSPFGLEVLLTCVVATALLVNVGNVVRERLDAALAAVQPVMQLVLFTYVGLSLDATRVLDANTVAVAFVVFAIRVVMTAAGTFFGGLWSREPVLASRIAWMPYITQAGVAIALNRRVRVRFSGLGTQFEAFNTVHVLLAVLAQLVGPALFRWSLRRAGEAGWASTHSRRDITRFETVQERIDRARAKPRASVDFSEDVVMFSSVPNARATGSVLRPGARRHSRRNSDGSIAEVVHGDHGADSVVGRQESVHRRTSRGRGASVGAAGRLRTRRSISLDASVLENMQTRWMIRQLLAAPTMGRITAEQLAATARTIVAQGGGGGGEPPMPREDPLGSVLPGGARKTTAGELRSLTDVFAGVSASDEVADGADLVANPSDDAMKGDEEAAVYGDQQSDAGEPGAAFRDGGGSVHSEAEGDVADTLPEAEELGVA